MGALYISDCRFYRDLRHWPEIAIKSFPAVHWLYGGAGGCLGSPAVGSSVVYIDLETSSLPAGIDRGAMHYRAMRAPDGDSLEHRRSDDCGTDLIPDRYARFWPDLLSDRGDNRRQSRH